MLYEVITKRLSLQKHFHRSEHWIVVSGTAMVTVGEQEILVRPNESTYIPMGSAHRLENPGKIDLVLIEAQVGEYTGEDDIVRIQDDFNVITSYSIHYTKLYECQQGFDKRLAVEVVIEFHPHLFT